MSTVVILNAVLAMLVVVGILSLLGRAVLADRAIAAPRSRRARGPVHDRKALAPKRLGPALDLNPE